MFGCICESKNSPIVFKTQSHVISTEIFTSKSNAKQWLSKLERYFIEDGITINESKTAAFLSRLNHDVYKLVTSHCDMIHPRRLQLQKFKGVTVHVIRIL